MKQIIPILVLFACSVSQAAERFLEPDEIESLTPVADVPGFSHYYAPGKNPSSYPKLIVGSVTFYFADDSKTKSIDATEMSAIEDALKKALTEAAVEKREVVLTQSPEAVLVNIAVTEINVQNKKRGLFGYTPTGFLITAARNHANKRLHLADANIEGELVDSVTGELVSIFSIEDIAALDDDGKMSWDDLYVIFKDEITKAIATWE